MTRMQCKKKAISKGRVFAAVGKRPASFRKITDRLGVGPYGYHMVRDRIKKLEREGSVIRTNFRPAKYIRVAQLFG